MSRHDGSADEEPEQRAEQRITIGIDDEAWAGGCRTCRTQRIAYV